ncbi:MAG: phosphoribosyltransferase [Sphingomonadales bacterium]|nr:MAG: phosphoribosyltransferase [Sphingomonadales bacterium]TNF02684.1 MAG: phosphoribosyltransferase [Sphingomonadales bacterium]
MNAPLFRDRRAAGRRLAMALGRFAPMAPVILALPRGGVPVAYEIATSLHAPLDLLLVRKIGAPGNEEYGIGAVIDGADPQLVLNEEAMKRLAPGPDYIRAEMHRQLAELERRRRAYLGERPPPSLSGRTVILVDDGIATGGTMKAALQGARKARPERLILAVPVAPRETLETLRDTCDEVICLATPHPFYSVGACYTNFDQTDDEEVQTLLHHAEHALATSQSASHSSGRDEAPHPQDT